MLAVIRLAGFAVLAVTAAAAWFLLKPNTPTTTPSLPSATQYETLITRALSDDDANAARTETAPQQQVVNGWVARDLLTIVAKENADLLRASGAIVESNGTLRTNPFDERIPALLGVAVLVLIWDGVTRSVKAWPQALAAVPLGDGG